MAAATSGSSGSGSVDPAVQLSPVVSPSGPAATGDVKIEINSAGAAAAAAAAGDAVKPSVKTLYLIRHGESTMNEFQMRDPLLSTTGQEQVKRLHQFITESKVCAPVQLVIVSPFTRALMTAIGAFVGEPNTSAHALTAAAAADTKSSDAKSAAPAPVSGGGGGAAPPFLVTPLIREVLDTWSDVGVSPDQILDRLPSHAPESLRRSIASRDGGLTDDWWYYNPSRGRDSVSAEPKPVLDKRISDFKLMLLKRPETHICVVGHSMFFKHFVPGSSKMKNCELKIITLSPPTKEGGEPLITLPAMAHRQFK